MKLTKTWLSYIVWGFFSIIFFSNIGIAAIEIYMKNEMTDFFMPMLILYGGTILGILLLFGLYKLFEKFILPKMTGETPVLQGIAEWFVLAIVVFVAVAVRVVVIIAATGNLEGTTLFYEQAISNNTGNAFDFYNNGACIYSGLLGFVLSFLGHIPNAAMGVQTVIQVLTIVAAYFMLKKALGRVVAWISILCVSFLPGSFFAVRVITPDALFLLLFVLFLLALVYICSANREQKIKTNIHLLFYISIGLFAAVLSYFDGAGLIAFIIGIVALAQYKNEDAWLKIQKPVLQILIYALAFVFALLLMLWFFPTGGAEVGPDAVMSYLTSFIPNGEINPMILTPHKGQWDVVAVFVLSGLWFVGFLRTKADKAFPYALMIIYITVASLLNISAYDYTMLISFLWIVIAAIGLASINDFRKTERDVAIAEKNKETNAKRKEKREQKRMEASGEKSIRLDEVNRKGAQSSASYGKGNVAAGGSGMRISANPYSNADVAEKKGYGVGRKAEATAQVIQVANNTQVVSETQNAYNYNINSTMTSVEESVPVVENKPDYESKTVVKKVDRPPLGMQTTTYPYQDKPGTVYTQPSRSRRSLRSPSKSTFTPEDLERISRYTGVSYMVSQTVQTKPEETYPEIVEETVNTVVEPIVENNVPVQETVITEQTVVSEVSEQAPVADNGYIELAATAESMNDTLTTEVNIANDVTDPMNSEQVSEQDVTEENVATPEETSVQTEAQTEEAKTDNLSPYRVYNPSRRHFRTPSKSTFSPEELERIREFTGMNYQTTSDINKTQSVQPDVKTEKPAQNSPVIEQRSVVRTITPVSTEKKEEKIDVAQVSGRNPKLIRNPLPGPKPHVSKELNYDYIPKESEMDFDIKDLTGKDYFDL